MDKIWLDDAAGLGAAAFPFCSMCLLYFVVVIAVTNLLNTHSGFFHTVSLSALKKPGIHWAI